MAEDGSGPVGDEARAALADKIAAVRNRFLANLAGRTEELTALARRAAGADLADALAARDDLRRGLHNLAGGAPTIGLASIGRDAAALEARVVAAPRGPLAPALAAAVCAGLERLGAG